MCMACHANVPQAGAKSAESEEHLNVSLMKLAREGLMNHLRLPGQPVCSQLDSSLQQAAPQMRMDEERASIFL